MRTEEEIKNFLSECTYTEDSELSAYILGVIDALRWVLEEIDEPITDVNISMMYSDNIKKYSDAFPNEIKRAIKSLNNDVNYAILSLLIQKGELSFTEIVEELNIDDNLFSKNVKKLIESGLVQNLIKNGDIREKYSYYKLTSFGYKLLTSIFKCLDVD